MAIAPPTGLTVQFSATSATLAWNEVPGSQGYDVTVRPLGVQGPYGAVEMLANRYTVPFARFPDYGRDKNGYSYRVCSVALSGQRRCTSVDGSFYVRAQSGGVSTHDLHKAAAKGESCLRKGAVAALVTAAGGGTIAAAVGWVPGVDAITAANVGVATARAGATRFVSCLLER